MRNSSVLALALSCSLLKVIHADIIINEIHFDAEPKTEFVEFVELHNTGTAPVSLAGWEFNRGISYTFPAGASIPAGGFLVVSENPTALKTKFGADSVGPYIGNLASDGEAVTLKDNVGRTIDEVDYQLGFPWPTVGEAPGYSIELIHPSLDNSLGAHWRPSVKGSVVPQTEQTLIPRGSSWRYIKGTAEASSPTTFWRSSGFSDATWAEGELPIGFDPNIPMATPLNDMRYAYSSVFLRKTFTVEDASKIGALTINALYDGGIKVWINGQPVFNANISAGELPFDGTAGDALESDEYMPLNLPNPAAYLVNGQNIVAIQAHNSSLGSSSDFYLDLELIATIGAANAGPTPGWQNAAFVLNAPPAVRQVEHLPKQPRGGDQVSITAKVTNPNGVKEVVLEYQVVTPGNYVELDDPAYQQNWVSVTMSDNGLSGDVVPADAIYTAIIPASVQSHRNLVRYRLRAADNLNVTVDVPYPEDPVPNFAYFVYNGVPSWQGAINPESGDPNLSQAVQVGAAEMNRMPVYHLIAKNSAVEESTWLSRYTGDVYRWGGTLVYDGKVYDHIRYRARGGVWRYAMGKNMWKFDFNKGHDFEARDNYGNKYKTSWAKLNLGSMIQQGNFYHRGEQGLFESVGFKLFNLAGVESPNSHYIQFRVIDNASETGTTQYHGDFWGLYLAIEQEDGNFLDEHNLPDGNLYKMEGGTGELNNTARTGPLNKEDLNSFLATYRSGTASDEWWRENFDVEKYYSYQAIVQGIHHYDICYGKNYFYFHNPETDKWSVHTWDLDLTWADNMYDAGCGGTDEFKNRLLTRPAFGLEYRNRVREIRDLLFNTDQAYQVIDEYAAIAQGTNSGPSLIDADRMMWDYNSIMIDPNYTQSDKGGHGRYYAFPIESASNPELKGSFEAAALLMKAYVVKRAEVLNGLALDTAIPAKPHLTSPTGRFPVNKVILRSSNYSGSNPFASMQYRIGEITPTPAYGQENKYEIETVWESPELTSFTEEIIVPAGFLKVGHTYRARVQFKDTTGRTSNWSEPVQFVAAEADNAVLLQQSLVVTELMYAPTINSDFEFIELKNISSSETLRLEGLKFTSGIDYEFPLNISLSPGEYLVLTKSSSANNYAAFRTKYGLSADVRLLGPYSGSLANEGEKLTLKTSADGAVVLEIEYDDGFGWPAGAESSGHSIVFHNTSDFRAQQNYGPSWGISSHINGSPGGENPTAASTLVLNEVVANIYAINNMEVTNDWIEIYNPTTQPISLNGFYLSDSGNNLKKFALPNATIAPNQWMVFDETNHFNQTAAGFGLSPFGETVYLSYLPGNEEDRIVDVVKFGAHRKQYSISRIPDGNGTWAWSHLTRGSANSRAPFEAFISEVMYHPAQPVDDTSGDYSWREYVEIYNPNVTPLALTNEFGNWRLSGGVDFTFTNTVIEPRSTLLAVKFDPSNPTEVHRFKTFYNLGTAAQLVGPYTGNLDNSGERVALEMANRPNDLAATPTYMLVDEIYYNAGSPWPQANGNGNSLQRIVLETGLIPQNWNVQSPTPGQFATSSNGDMDQDGLPDAWELSNGLDPNVSDAARDADSDGASNLQEYRSGTDPRDSASIFKLTTVQSSASQLLLTFQAEANRSYELQTSSSVLGSNWSTVKLYQPTSNRRSISETVTIGGGLPAFYRVLLK